MILIIAAVILIIILSALAVVSYLFLKKSLYPVPCEYEEGYRRELEKESFDEDFYNSLEKEEIYVDSRYGYSLHGIWIPNNESRETVILVHGYTANLFTSLRYLKLFFDKGYNVLIYDHRFHGKSGGSSCSMGYYEKFDLMTMVSWVIEKTGPLSVVGIHGESMGAATAVMHAAIDERIAFTIADCPYEDLFTQFAYRLKIEYRLPAFPFMYTSSIMSKIMLKFSFRDVSPVRDLPDIKKPVLFIHGDSDDYIPAEHSIHMYQSLRGRKGLYLAKGAAHAESIFVDRAEYDKIVSRFLASIKPVGTE